MPKICSKCGRKIGLGEYSYNGECEQCYKIIQSNKEENCKKCGKKLNEEDIVFMGYCEECYNQVNHIETTSNDNEEYEESYVGVMILCFLIPIIGFNGYITHINSDYPLAKKCLNSALCGIALIIIATIILVCSMG